MKSRLYRTLSIAALGATAALIASCNKPGTPAAPPAPPVVITTTAEKADVAEDPLAPSEAKASVAEVKAAAKAPALAIAMFGGDSTRNMGNFTATNIPAEPKPDGPNMLWKADLGSRAYGGPTISGGKVVVGTNNDKPRNPRDIAKNMDGDEEPIDRGVLMCFDVKDGKFLWQAVHKKLESGQVNDWPREGVCSTPTIEGNRVYYISNRCTVVCADMNGRADGVQGKPLAYTDERTKKLVTFDSPTDADILWEFDLMKQVGVFPHNMSAGCPLIVGDILYTVTANGVDEGHINIPAPDAPSFIALDKNTGKLIWRANQPGKSIMHGQWSNPLVAEFGGKKQIIFPGGDGWIYAFTPDTGDLIWKFDANPKDTKYELGGTGTRSDFIGTPVLHDDKLYIGTGQDPEHFSGIAHFYCIDPSTKKGDISPEIGPMGEKGKPNPNSAVVWHYGGTDVRKLVPREFKFGRTMSTCTIVDGVLYIAELQGYIHCLDAKTGKKFWQYDVKSSIWGSTYYADGKIYLATEGGDLFVFKHDKNPKQIDELDNPASSTNKEFSTAVKAKRKQIEELYLLHKIEFDAPIRSTPIVADGVLYVMTEKSLYAFANKK